MTISALVVTFAFTGQYYMLIQFLILHYRSKWSDPDGKAQRMLAQMLRKNYSPEDWKALMVEAGEALNLDPKMVEKCGSFACDKFHPVPLGVIGNYVGGHLGLPTFFHWKHPEEVQLNVVQHKPIYNVLLFKTGLLLNEADVPEDKVQRLKELFIVSDSAKKYIIAESMAEMTFEEDYWSTFYMLGSYLAIWHLATQTNHKFNLLTKAPLQARVALYISWGSLYLIVLGALFHSRWLEVTKEKLNMMKALGPENLRGGIDYYEQMLERGKLLREIIKYGDYYFEESGALVPYWYLEGQLNEVGKLEVLKTALKDIENEE